MEKMILMMISSWWKNFKQDVETGFASKLKVSRLLELFHLMKFNSEYFFHFILDGWKIAVMSQDELYHF